MAKHDVDFDVAAARSWKREVDDELIRVEEVLNQIASVSANDPADDSIIQIFIKIGEVEREAWGGMCKAFHQAGEFLNDLIDGREKRIQGMADTVNAHKNEFHI